MQEDKAIIKALQEETASSLPPDFGERAMFCIYKEAEKKEKQNFFFMLGSLSVVSLGLIAMAAYLLKKYFSFDFAFHFQLPSLKLNSVLQYSFSIYIATLILVLVFLDHIFRTFWNKRKYGRNVEQ